MNSHIIQYNVRERDEGMDTRWIDDDACEVGGGLAFAKDANSACVSAKEKAWKAKQVDREPQRAIRSVRNETRPVFSNLVECRPGTILTAGRVDGNPAVRVAGGRGD